MNDDTVEGPAGVSVEYDAQRAADYLTMKAHENGDPNTVFDAQSVNSLATTGAVNSIQPQGSDGPYRFKIVDLQRYVRKLYPLSNTISDVDPQPALALGYMLPAQSRRSFKKYLEEDPLWLLSGMMLAAFLAGAAAILFVAPWLRTAIGDDFIHTIQPITTKNVMKTESMLTATPVDSELGKKIGAMLTRKAGVFSGYTQPMGKDVISLIRQTGPNGDDGHTLRDMVKNGEGPFETVEKAVKLQFVNFSDLDSNNELEKVRNFNVGACKGDFEYGSTINIYAPLVQHKLMDPGNLSMYTFFAGAEVTFDCDRKDGELPIIWVNLEEFARSFRLDSAAVIQTSDSVEAKVMVGLQPVALIPNSSI